MHEPTLTKSILVNVRSVKYLPNVLPLINNNCKIHLDFSRKLNQEDFEFLKSQINFNKLLVLFKQPNNSKFSNLNFLKTLLLGSNIDYNFQISINKNFPRYIKRAKGNILYRIMNTFLGKSNYELIYVKYLRKTSYYQYYKKNLTALKIDQVVVTPYVDLFSNMRQRALIQAANDLDLETVLLVSSWDNLVTKGKIFPLPEKIYIWNELLRKQATDFHDVPSKNLYLFKSPYYGNLKQRNISKFDASKLGSNQKFTVLYLGSSKFICPDEFIYLKNLAPYISKLNSNSIRLEIRFHSSQSISDRKINELRHLYAEYGIELLNNFNNIFSRLEEDDDKLFKSIIDADLIIALNTSAILDCNFVGVKPLCIILDDISMQATWGTPHFHMLNKYDLINVIDLQTNSNFITDLDSLNSKQQYESGFEEFVGMNNSNFEFYTSSNIIDLKMEQKPQIDVTDRIDVKVEITLAILSSFFFLSTQMPQFTKNFIKKVIFKIRLFLLGQFKKLFS